MDASKIIKNVVQVNLQVKTADFKSVRLLLHSQLIVYLRNL